MRRLAVTFIALSLVAVGCGGEDEEPAAEGPYVACGEAPDQPALVLTYAAEKEGSAASEDEVEAAADSLCDYFPELADEGGEVAVAGRDRIRVSVEDPEQAEELSQYAEVPTVFFVDWEANLVRDGALPSRAAALRLAPETGVTIVHEFPIDPTTGQTDEEAEPGWYALRNESIVDGDDIAEADLSFDASQQPVVTFEFTEKGVEEFEQLTRKIPPGGHFAIVLGGEVITRPIIDAEANPNGIDASNGLEISGGFASVEEARQVAAALQINSLDVDLELLEAAGSSAP